MADDTNSGETGRVRNQNRFLAMLACERFVPLSGEALAAEMTRLYRRLPYPVRVTPGEKDSIVIMIDDAMIAVMLFDLPIPAGTLDQAVTGNPLWPDAAATIGRHQAHAIVTSLKSADNHAGAVSNALATTLVVSALAHLVPCLGLYWASAETVAPAERAKAAGTDLLRGELPIDIWSRCYFRRDEGEGGRPKTGVLTRGLFPFLGRELEIAPVPMNIQEIGARVIGIIGYLIKNGPVYRDGESAGISETEKFRIRHVESAQVKGLPVILMILEAQDPAASANFAAHSAFGSPATRSFGRRTTPVRER